MYQIKRLKWKWAGHLARYKENRWTKNTTFWYLENDERKKKETKDKMG